MRCHAGHDVMLDMPERLAAILQETQSLSRSSKTSKPDLALKSAGREGP